MDKFCTTFLLLFGYLSLHVRAQPLMEVVAQQDFNRMNERLLSPVVPEFSLVHKNHTSLMGSKVQVKTKSPVLQSEERRMVKTTEKVPGVNYFVVETQVILDSVLAEAIKNSMMNETTYLGIFFHTVNHIYANSHLSDESFPTVVFQVSQFSVLSKTVEQKVFKSQLNNGEDVIDIELVLQRIRNYGKKTNGKYDKYDHTILLTGRDLYRKVNGMFEPDVLGVAYLRGACTKSSDEKYEAFSVVEDVGGHHLGVYPAVHEFAHNFGVKHDSKKAHCSAADGFIMSPSTLRTDNMFQFSSCSLETMKEFLLSSKSKCLAKTSIKPVIPPNKFIGFPGDHYSMSELCEYFARISYNEVGTVIVNPSKSPSYLCKQLSCKITVSSSKKIVFEPPFAPGENIPCGYYGKGRCNSGECVEPQLEHF